jgi:multisubunit Na+/H+ antiporter MnhF subunit
MIVLGDPLLIATVVSLGLVCVGLAAACVRLVLGPSLADRVVALDFISVGLVAITALLAIQTEHTAYLDVGAAVALTAFLATVAFARYAERRGAEGRNPGLTDE